MNDYIKFHTESLTKVETNCKEIKESDSNFLIFRPHPNAGLGSILLGLASALLYAILSKRVILVDWKGQIGCQSSLSELFSQNTIKWDFSAFKCPTPERPFRLEMNANVKNLEFFECSSDFVWELSGDQFVQIESSYYYAPILQNNRMYANLLNNQQFDNWLSVFSEYFLKLNTTLNKRYLDMKQTLFTRNHTNVLGVHLRRNIQDPQFYDTNKDLFWKCIDEIKSSFDGVFLATDDLDLYDEAISKFDLIYMPREMKKVGVFREKHEIENALVEMMLFQNVNDLMVTEGSAYSLVVKGLTGINPIMVNQHKCERISKNFELRSMPHKKFRILC